MKELLQTVKEAGVAGVISYGLVQVAFPGVPPSHSAYYQVTSDWPDLSVAEDQSKLAAEAFAFLNFARLLLPLRVAVALAMSEGVQKNLVDTFQNTREWRSLLLSRVCTFSCVVPWSCRVVWLSVQGCVLSVPPSARCRCASWLVVVVASCASSAVSS